MAVVGVDFDLSFLDITTTVKTNASANATTIDVTTSVGMAAEDTVAITLDDADVHWDIIASVTDADTIVITNGIPSAAAATNVVKTYQSFICRQRGETKDFLVSDAPLTPQTLITESASPTNLQPEREIQISQVNWTKGFQDFMLEDEHRYYDSENCDARLKGEVTLSPKKLAAITWEVAPTTPTITDGGLETWQDATTPNAAWTEGGDTINRYFQNGLGAPHGGTYWGGWYEAMGGNETITQEIISSGNIANYKGMLLKAKCWIQTNDTTQATVKIKLDDGDTNTESSGTIAANSTWESVEIEHRISYSATSLDLVITGTSGTNDYAWVDDITLELTPASATGAVTKFMEFGDTLVAAVDKNLYEVKASSTEIIATFENNITDLCVFENNLYIAQGWSAAYWYTSDLETYTKSTLVAGVTANVTATTAVETAAATSIQVVDSSVFSAAGVYARWEDEIIEVDVIDDGTNITAVRAQLGSTAAAHATGTDITELAAVTGAKYMSNVGGSQFWISDTNSTMRASDDPINSGTPFSTAYQVDSDDWDITALVDHEDTVFCRKEDNTYYLSGADVLELIPELSAEASTTYTYGLYRWKDGLYIGSGTNSFYEYDLSSGTVTTISPVRYAVGDTDYDEELLAVCGDETYLYAAFDNGSDIKILAGRWETIDGDTDWWWHPLYTLASHNDIKTMIISSLPGSKRLYTGTDTASDGLIPYIIPIGYSQPYTESNYECVASGTFYTPWYRGSFPTEDKYWKSVSITSICCDGAGATAETTITPSYRTEDASWTALTKCTQSADATSYPAETTDSRVLDVTTKRIQFKFAMATDDDDYTPILYGTGGGIVAYGVLQGDKKRQITATLQVCTNLTERNDSKVTRTVSTDLTNLRALYDAGAKMTVIAPDDTEYDVVFTREGYQEQLAYYPDLREEVWLCTLRLLEV